MSDDSPSGTIRIAVVDGRDRQPAERLFDLPRPATVADALRAAGLEPATSAVAVRGRRRAPDDALAEGDRVECLAPLRADPKLARRSRAKRRLSSTESSSAAPPAGRADPT